jgi:hypothetical protein
MAIEDLIRNTELLKRVLEHYKYRLENFTDDEDIKPLISGPAIRYLTFGHLKTLLSQALNELTEHGNTANLNLPEYTTLFRSAANQFVKDLERIKKKSSQELDTRLAELESDLETVNKCLG